MTSCDQCQADIVALFDNEARNDDLQLAAGHLQDCPECRAFCLDLIAIRRTLASAAVPGRSPALREAVLDHIRGDPSDDHGNLRRSDEARSCWGPTLLRWAAVLVISLLAIACFTLDRRARELRAKLGAAEQEVAAMHEQSRLADSEARQQKAISALYFRMAELEDRVNRSSPPERTSFPARVYERPERQNNL